MAACVLILLSEVEQEQRRSGNGDRGAIVVGAGLCDGEGERAYTAYAPHHNIFASRTNVFSFLEGHLATKTFRRPFVAETSAAKLSPKRPESYETPRQNFWYRTGFRINIIQMHLDFHNQLNLKQRLPNLMQKRGTD